jgi:hypothetical protein
MIRRNKCCVPGIMVLFLFMGCGYHFTPTGENIGRDVKTVYVAVFTNGTSEANIESVFRNAFIDQFIKGRRFRVVKDEDGADALLKGDIKNLVISHLAYRGDNIALEKRITVTLSLTLEEKNANKTIWHEENFSQWGDYALDGNSLIAGQDSQKNALVKLANDAAERAYRMMVSDF